MSFRRLHKWVTYAIAGVGLWVLTLGGELPPWMMGAIGAAYLTSWFAEAPRIDRPGWSRGWTTAVVAVLGVQLLRALTGEPPFGMAVEFAAFLVLSRLFNRRTAADFQQIIVLSFLHLIAGTVLTTGLTYGALFVAFVIVTPWMLALTHLRVEIEGNYPADETPERGAKIARVLSSRRIVGPAFLGWTAALSVPLFLSTIAMFVLFPRVGFGFVSMGDRRGQSVAGFGDDIELGGFGVIRDDPTVVLRVTPLSDIAPDQLDRVLRLRGTAFDHYDGRRWTRSESEREPIQPVGDYYPFKRAFKSGDVRVKVVLEGLEQPVLFLPHGTQGLSIPSVGSAGHRRSRRVSRGHGFDVRYESQDEAGLVYEAVLSTDPSEDGLPISEQFQLARYLQLPAGHDALIDYVRRLTAEQHSPADKARALLALFRDSGRFSYSLEQGDPGEGPPLMAFVFGHRQGHCEYFATALAIALRAVGIPSRNVTGFVGGTFNPYGRYFAVQQGQAHSWVEAVLPGRGWVTLDPTPPARHDAAAPRSLISSVREMVDAMRTYWLMKVIGYDLGSQLGGLRSLGRWFRGLSSFASLGGSGQGDSNEAPEVDRVAVATGAGLGLLVCVLLWLTFRLLRRRVGGQVRALAADAERAQHLYLRMQSVLSRRGLKRPPAVTPEAFASSLQAQGFEGASTVELVTRAYIAARFGGEPLDAARTRALTRDVEALRKAS